MMDAKHDAIRDVIQQDVNQRGLRADPQNNLVSACADDFREACASVARHPKPTLAVVTGFYIPTGQPPAGETDGPLGAVFLARALSPLGIRVVLATDDFCVKAVQAGLNLCNLRKEVPVVTLPTARDAGQMSVSEYQQYFRERVGPYSHLLAIERAGPSHSADSLRSQCGEAAVCAFLECVPPESHDRCHTMRGRDITSTMSPTHRLFGGDAATVTTIGIGDGGNEIGMGKISWETIRKNVPGGAQVACRVATYYLIVAGISNWGAYGLATGVHLVRDVRPDPSLYNAEREFEILEAMVEAGPLVDGVSGMPAPTVDGLSFDKYAEVLTRLGEMVA